LIETLNLKKKILNFGTAQDWPRHFWNYFRME